MGNREDAKRAAQTEALSMAKKGKAAWKRWSSNHGKPVDFSGLNIDINFDGFVFYTDVDFSGAKLSTSSFFSAQFKRNVLFVGTEFHARAMFERAVFEEEANCSDAKFEDVATFKNARFLKNSNFNNIDFHQFTLFECAEFGGEARFEEAEFKGDADFTGTKFERRAAFQDTVFSKSATFKDARFLADSSFDEVWFYQLPNFVGTEVKIIPSLQIMNFKFEESHDPDVAICYRKLKQWAIDGADHEKEIFFFAKEMRAKRVYELKRYRADWIWNLLYQVFSYYGTSVFRPAVGLLAVYLIFFGLYWILQIWCLPGQQCLNELTYLFYLAGENLFPLPGGIKLKPDVIAECLYGGLKNTPGIMLLLTKLESIFGAIFLFLIILGIRNKFKIK